MSTHFASTDTSLSYFGEGKRWADISREERFFCQALFQHISADVNQFIRFLNANTSLTLDDTAYWEAGYEVCFYRDILRSQGYAVSATEYPAKRTFDLCLFSETTIVVIEAKAQQPFKKKQLEYIARDRDWIPQLLKRNVAVQFLALASETYFEQHAIWGLPNLLSDFDAQISWATLFNEYRADALFTQANEAYSR